MAVSLAVKYRPQTFAEVVGESQKTIITILEKQLKTKNFKHVYLFTGKSGAGKTTCARILANKINNGIGYPQEIDAASNNSVDNIRAIVDDANKRALEGIYKIIILDECHMLSSAAWNAFLKTVEEPPEFTLFMLCTTNPEKIPQTILNRAQRYNFAPIASSEIKNRLLYICKQEGFTNYELTCDFISKRADGGMRDAISLLEKCADFSKDLNINNVKQVLGGLSYENMFNLTWALQKKDEGKVISIIEQMYNNGQNLKQFIDNYLDFILDLNKFILFKDISVTKIPEYLATKENAVVQFTVQDEKSLDYFNDLVEALLELKLTIKYDLSFKTTIIAFLLKFIRG